MPVMQAEHQHPAAEIDELGLLVDVPARAASVPTQTIRPARIATVFRILSRASTVQT
ncbi:hypothetical protein [Streptomyces griseus]|uniref:hypothetical protein n=1 Tax=Streptomyces griseus TaxID=1911 RepID=UPI000A5D9E13|nr:hypothetical protein [Streptomyces griseus]